MRRTGLGRLAIGALVACAVMVPASAGADEGVTPGGLVTVQNYLEGAPEQASEITLPMTLQQAPGKKGYYWAQQFYFQNKSLGYTGIKPEGVNPDGTSVNSFAFSSFDPEATTNDPNCKPGADGGGGVSCNARSNLVPNRAYELHAKITGSDGQRQQVEGTAVDTASGEQQHLGSWSLPAAAGPIGRVTIGFMEHYLPLPNCEALPHASVLMGIPLMDGKPYAFTNADNYKKQPKCPGKGAAAMQNDGIRMFY
jgi:hypothetical protein